MAVILSVLRQGPSFVERVLEVVCSYSCHIDFIKSAHTALAVKACLLGGNSYTKCSITFVNIAVAISALAGGGQKRFPNWVGNCLGIFFFSLGIFFWISGSHHFPCYLQHFGAGNCHFHGMCNGFEFEPLIFHCIFHGICNSLQHVLSIFHALCSIFELESAFPPYVQHFTATFLTVLAGFWS